MPEEVTPALGPDATALGQIYWYTLEGRDPKTGKPTGGWDPHELRTLQDFYVKYALTSAQGVSEVRSEEHTSELQSLMRISYAVFCLKKKTYNTTTRTQNNNNMN